MISWYYKIVRNILKVCFALCVVCWYGDGEKKINPYGFHHERRLWIHKLWNFSGFGGKASGPDGIHLGLLSFVSHACFHCFGEYEWTTHPCYFEKVSRADDSQYFFNHIGRIGLAWETFSVHAHLHLASVLSKVVKVLRTELLSWAGWSCKLCDGKGKGMCGRGLKYCGGFLI